MSKLHLIENEFLSLSVSEAGAEMHSLYNKKLGLEHLWQADKSHWAWHAPNLFPVVGQCRNNEIVVNNNHYSMNRHGFARHSHFTLEQQDETSLHFKLIANESTRKHFPFNFELKIIYQLTASRVKIQYEVFNPDAQILYFQLGAHPAFKVPFFENELFSDYYVLFFDDEKIDSSLLGESGLFSNTTTSIALKNKKLPLSYELFKDDALVLKNLSSKKVRIASDNHSLFVDVCYEDFKYLGIWTPHSNAPFLCVEPWNGCADNEMPLLDFSQKEGIISLKPQACYSASYEISINC